MPQISHAHAVGRVRTAEKTLLTRAAVERLSACPDAGALTRALMEMGWGDGNSVDALARRALQDACGFLRSVTPDSNATDCFLAKYDVLNLKTLVKARALGMEDPPLSSCGVIDVETLRLAVNGEKRDALPAPYAQALDAIDQRNVLQMDPLFSDAELDKALFAEIQRRLAHVREKQIRACFAARADAANLQVAIRTHDMGRDASFAAQMFVQGGNLSQETLCSIAEDPQRAKAAVKGMPYQAYAWAGLEVYEKGGGLAALEKQMDDYEISLFRPYRYQPESLLPLIGYFLARERESALVRLIAAAKTAHLDRDAWERFAREIYVRQG